MRDLAAHLRLLRPGNALTSAVAVWVGALVAGAPWAPTRAVLLGALAALAFAAAGNVRNDLTDVEVDRRAHPTRPLVTGAVSPAAARALTVLLYVVALAAAAGVNLAALLLVALALPLMETYERRLKQRGLAGNLAIALLAAAPFLMGGIAWSATTSDAGWPLVLPPWSPALLAVAGLAALATAGREVLKDVEDAESDRGHRVTLPLRVGKAGAARVAGGFLAAAAVLSPLPWMLETVIAWPYLPAVGVADACFLVAAATGGRRPARGQRLAKLGMVAALAALLIGRAAGSDPF